jgi:hypothetical protein
MIACVDSLAKLVSVDQNHVAVILNLFVECVSIRVLNLFIESISPVIIIACYVQSQSADISLDLPCRASRGL